MLCLSCKGTNVRGFYRLIKDMKRMYKDDDFIWLETFASGKITGKLVVK